MEWSNKAVKARVQANCRSVKTQEGRGQEKFLTYLYESEYRSVSIQKEKLFKYLSTAKQLLTQIQINQ